MTCDKAVSQVISSTVTSPILYGKSMNEKTQPELSTESMFETINQPTHTFSDVKLTSEAMTEQSSDFTMTEKNHDSSQTSGNWLESDHISTTKDLTTEEQSADKITTEAVNFGKSTFII